jgi:rRNA-processing protein FCF1
LFERNAMARFDRYIIDTNVLLQYPEVLATASSHKLVIPRAVLGELQGAPAMSGHSELNDAISKALRQGVHIAQKVAIPEGLGAEFAVKGLHGADVQIAALAIDYANKMGPAKICVVTVDRGLSRFLSSKGISSITGPQFLFATHTATIDFDILGSAKKSVSKQRIYVAASFLLGLVASLVGRLSLSHYRSIVQWLSVPGTAAGLVVIGVGLYWCRQHFRLSYGAFELFVGAIMSYSGVSMPSFDYSRISTATAVPVLSGLYVMVRGLDNLGRGTKGTSTSTAYPSNQDRYLEWSVSDRIAVSWAEALHCGLSLHVGTGSKWMS